MNIILKKIRGFFFLTQKSDINFITTYFPTDNPNHESEKILALKNGNGEFYIDYGEKVRNFIIDKKIEEYEIIVAPTSKEGFPNNGITKLVRYLEKTYSEHNVIYDILKRSKTIESSRLSNKRTIKRHLDSVEVTTSNLKNRRFLVIDDVSTSGSTLHAIEKILYQNKAEKVILLAVAKTKE